MSNDKLQTSAFEASNLTEAIKLSEILQRSSLLNKDLRGKAADILFVVMKGRELGWGAMRALSHIDVIQGKLVINATGLAGLVQERPDICEYFRCVETTPEKATYETKRKGHPTPTSVTYTMERARLAGLASKDNWKRMPTEMLRARASSELARMVYPDVLAGVYAAEEMPEKPLTVMPADDHIIDLSADDPQMNQLTGEVPMGTKAYDDMSTEERVAYWTGEFDKAPDESVLRVVSDGMRAKEADGSPVRSALKEVFLRVANGLRAGKAIEAAP